MFTEEPEALQRARRDIARGDLGTARIRLGSYLRHDPDHAVARAYLVELCRKAGDPADAGRWGYLTDQATDAERDAFDGRFGGDRQLVRRQLQDATRVSQPSAAAQQRLGKMEELRPRGRLRDEPIDHSASWSERLFGLGCGLCVLWALFLALLGAWQVSQWVLH